MRLWWLAVLLVMTASCRVHELEDGPYQFTLKDVLRDDCGLAANGTGVIDIGTLRTTGALVSMTYGYLGLELVGSYLNGVEKMVLDGSVVNPTTTVRGQECLLDAATMHLETDTSSPTAFSGSMSVVLTAKQADACVCTLWVTFEAKK